MRRWAAIVIAIVALVAMARPLLRDEVFSLRDHTGYFQPMRWFTAVELRNGRLPLWNPYNASGEPWLANPQTGVFYPPTWLFAACVQYRRLVSVAGSSPCSGALEHEVATGLAPAGFMIVVSASTVGDGDGLGGVGDGDGEV